MWPPCWFYPLFVSTLCRQKEGTCRAKENQCILLCYFWSLLLVHTPTHSHTSTNLYTIYILLHTIYIYNIYNAWMNVSCLSARYIYIYLPVHTLYTEWQYDLRYAHTVAKWYNMEMRIDMLCSMLRYDDKIMYYNMLSCVCVCFSSSLVFRYKQ